MELNEIALNWFWNGFFRGKVFSCLYCLLFLLYGNMINTNQQAVKRKKLVEKFMYWRSRCNRHWCYHQGQMGQALFVNIVETPPWDKLLSGGEGIR